MEALKNIIRNRAFKERAEPFTLKSGRKSQVYFDLRPILLSMNDLVIAVEDVESLLQEQEIEYQAVAGILDGGASLATALALGSMCPVLLVRKETKVHGMGGMVMGTENVAKGSKVLVVEDVATTGGSALRGVVALREAGYVVDTIIAIVDRDEGAVEACAKEGTMLFSLFTKENFSDKE